MQVRKFLQDRQVALADVVLQADERDVRQIEQRRQRLETDRPIEIVVVDRIAGPDQADERPALAAADLRQAATLACGGAR